MNVDKEEYGEDTCTCSSRDTTAREIKEGKDEDGYDCAWGEDVFYQCLWWLLYGELVLIDGSAKLNDATSNFFANEITLL